jgi:hypothetical protein
LLEIGKFVVMFVGWANDDDDVAAVGGTGVEDDVITSSM